MCYVEVKSLGPKAQETFMWEKSLDHCGLPDPMQRMSVE